MQTSILRPGLLVSLRTSIKGNVRYFTTSLEAEHITEAGEERARWETERTVRDPEEQKRALKARSLARSAVQTVCSHSDFGLLCLQENRSKLDAAIAKAEGIAREFNLTAEVSRLNVNVIIGEVAADDVRAIRSINQEMRDLMDAMASGLATLDVEAVRNAANKARSVGKMLEPNAKANVERALTIARTAARQIVKAGETGAAEIDQVAIQRLTEARTAFLDIDLEGDTQAPEAAAAVAVDFEPEAGFEADTSEAYPGQNAWKTEQEQATSTSIIDFDDDERALGNDPSNYNWPPARNLR